MSGSPGMEVERWTPDAEDVDAYMWAWKLDEGQRADCISWLTTVETNWDAVCVFAIPWHREGQNEQQQPQ